MSIVLQSTSVLSFHIDVVSALFKSILASEITDNSTLWSREFTSDWWPVNDLHKMPVMWKAITSHGKGSGWLYFYNSLKYMACVYHGHCLPVSLLGVNHHPIHIILIMPCLSISNMILKEYDNNYNLWNVPSAFAPELTFLPDIGMQMKFKESWLALKCCQGWPFFMRLWFLSWFIILYIEKTFDRLAELARMEKPWWHLEYWPTDKVQSVMVYGFSPVNSYTILKVISIERTSLISIGITTVKVRWYYGHFIFMMRIPISGRRHLNWGHGWPKAALTGALSRIHCQEYHRSYNGYINSDRYTDRHTDGLGIACQKYRSSLGIWG